ncbi:MAG: aminotransferase class III-fold pyridoxal phosphate-dependent enzyme, partial [Arenicellales bacterium]
FHGRTLTTIAATGNPKYLEGFGPPVEGFDQVPFGDLEAVKKAIGPETSAILIEPIQGEGGVRVAPSAFLRALRELCDKHGLMLIFDEVQTGIGRTGEIFAYERSGIAPDIMALAKALGGGFPIGACLATTEASKGMTAGTHGSTFGGNPFACRVALAVIDILERIDGPARARIQGARILAGLDDRLGEHPGIRSIRGQGLMLGVEMTTSCKELVSLALEERLLINVTADNVIRMLPPLIYRNEDSDELVDSLVKTIERFWNQ